MNIEEFFEMSAGKWFSHRSTHHLAFNQSEDGKSDIIIETLATDHPEVIQLCQIYEIALSSVACSARVTWNETRERDKQKNSGSTVIVTIPDVDNRDQGRLLRQTSSAKEAPVIGRYKIGSDDALTLTVKSETMYSEERLWFASPNLRMRARVLKRLDGFSLADFTSEIRMGGVPTATKVSETAKSSS